MLWSAFTLAHWQYRQRITTTGPVTRVKLDRATYDRADPNLRDLRVVRDGIEVPYLLTVANAQHQTEALAVRIVNQESRGGTLYATIELEDSRLRREPHNQIQLDIARENFRSRVMIEASDDSRQWATVRRAAYIFRYRADDGSVAEFTTLRYPDSRRRYLRLSISDWPESPGLVGAAAVYNRTSEARRSEIWTAANPAEVTRGRTSCFTLDTGASTPRDRAALPPAAGAPADFHRSVTVEQSSDGKFWFASSAAAIYRIAGEESLTIDFPESRLPFQRLCIFQGDDRPVRLSAIRLFGIDRELTFQSQAPGTYWLYFGAPTSAAPEYDLARTARATGPLASNAQPGSLGIREANPSYQPPPPPVIPWTDRHPTLLYIALALGVAGLGWTALRALRGQIR